MFDLPSFAKVPEGEFGLLFTDGSKFGRAEQLHLALLGLWAFEKKEKRLPEAGNLEEADAVVKLAEQVGFRSAYVHAYACYVCRSQRLGWGGAWVSQWAVRALPASVPCALTLSCHRYSGASLAWVVCSLNPPQ